MPGALEAKPIIVLKKQLEIKEKAAVDTPDTPEEVKPKKSVFEVSAYC